MLSIGIQSLAAQGVNNARGAFLLVIEIGNDIAFYVDGDGISVLVLELVPSVVCIRLSGYAGLLIGLVLHLTLGISAIARSYAALPVVLVFGHSAVWIGERKQFPALLTIAQLHAALLIINSTRFFCYFATKPTAARLRLYNIGVRLNQPMAKNLSYA